MLESLSKSTTSKLPNHDNVDMNFGTQLSTFSDLDFETALATEDPMLVALHLSGDDGHAMRGWGPRPSFGWVQALYNILLNAQLPSIKKAFLHKLMW